MLAAAKKKGQGRARQDDLGRQDKSTCACKAELARRKEDGKGGPRERSSDHALCMAWVLLPPSILSVLPSVGLQEGVGKETLGGDLSHSRRAAADCSIHTSLVAHLRRSGKHDMTSMRLYVVPAGIGRRYRYSRSACLRVSARVRSAADQKQTRPRETSRPGYVPHCLRNIIHTRLVSFSYSRPSPGIGHLQTAPSHPVQDLASWPVPGS